MRAIRTLLAAGAVVALAAACSGGSSSDGASDAASDVAALDLTGSWQLASGTTADGEIALVEAAPVTLDVAEDGTVSGRSACNQYSGSVTIDGSSVTFSPFASTMMACEESVMAVESAYLIAMGSVESGSRDGDALTLEGPDVELVFAATSAAATSTEALDMTGSWLLASGTTADGEIALVEAAPVTMDVAEDGTVSGRSACNQYSGSATIDGSSVTFGPFASTMMACEDAVMAVESAYLMAMGAVESGARNGDELILTGPSIELTFTAAG